MLENSSVELKTLVLLEFTKRLIISKNPIEFLVKEEQKTGSFLTNSSLGKSRIKAEAPKTKAEEFVEKVKKKITETEIQIPRQIVMQAPIRTAPIIRIPETRLPPQFAYLRPYATIELELDLGKLNPFLADPAINVIESNGPDQAVIVKGRMGTKPTNIILSREEIDGIIQIFSKKSKIPAGEGAVKIALGRYILSAIISEEAGSRFIIQKLPSAQRGR